MKLLSESIEILRLMPFGLILLMILIVPFVLYKKSCWLDALRSTMPSESVVHLRRAVWEVWKEQRGTPPAIWRLTLHFIFFGLMHALLGALALRLLFTTPFSSLFIETLEVISQMFGIFVFHLLWLSSASPFFDQLDALLPDPTRIQRDPELLQRVVAQMQKNKAFDEAQAIEGQITHKPSTTEPIKRKGRPRL